MSTSQQLTSRISLARSLRFPKMDSESTSGVRSNIPSEFIMPKEANNGSSGGHQDNLGTPVRKKYYMKEEDNGVKPLPGYQFPLRYEGGENSLFYACEQDNVDVVIRLIAHGVDPNCRKDGYHQMHIVHVAAANGAVNVLSYLLTDFAREFSYKPSQLANLLDAEGSTGLHWALQKRWKKFAILLLQNGARIDLAQTSGFVATPVCIACSQGLVDILELMWTQSPKEFTNSLSMADDEGFLPIHLAALMNALPVLAFLIDKGADPNAVDGEGRTPILLSAAAEAWSAVKLLVKNGAHPFQADRMGRTVIHLSSILGSFPQQNAALGAEFCPDIKAEVAQHVNDKDSLGCTALHYASAYGNLEVFKHLVQKGANIKIRSAEKKSVLHYAAQYGAAALIKMLLTDNEYDVSYMINLSDNRGDSPLLLATRNGNKEIVELLILKGALLFRDEKGRTAVHAAAVRGYTDIINLLLIQFPKSLNYADYHGDTALHIAAISTFPTSVSCLLSNGAALLENAKGRSPIDLAIGEKNQPTALAFVNHKRWREVVNSASIEYGSVAMGLAVTLPEVMLVALDRCILLSDHVALDPEYHILYDFTLLEPLHEMETKENSGKEKEPEQDTVDILKGISLNNELVCHPLTRMLLERKWRMYGMYAYCSLFISYLLFLALLTFLIVTGIQTRLIPKLLMASYNNVQHFEPNAVNSSGFQNLLLRAQREATSENPDVRHTYLGCAVAVLLLLLLFLMKEIIELRSKGWRYFNDVVNYLEIVMIGCCLTFVCSYLYELHASQDVWLTWQIAALTIFLAWFNLLRYCQPFGTFGMYAVMFFTVLKTLIKVSAFFFILTASFTVTFYGLLPTLVYPKNPNYYTTFSADEPPKARDLKTPHPNLYTSALRVGAMTIGDVDTISNFINPLTDGTLPFPVMTFVVLIVFFLMMPILLNNLLTGLAVGDISATLRLSLSHRLRNQIEVHRFIEILLPRNVSRRWKFRLQCYKYYPNVSPGWLDEISRWLAGGTKKDRAQWNRKLPVGGKKIPKGPDLTSRKKLLDDISSELRNFAQRKKTKNLINGYPEESSAIVGNHRESSSSTLPVSSHSSEPYTASWNNRDGLPGSVDANNRRPSTGRHQSLEQGGELIANNGSFLI